jgi:hypothetical protein
MEDVLVGGENDDFTHVYSALHYCIVISFFNAVPLIENKKRLFPKPFFCFWISGFKVIFDKSFDGY